MIKFVKFRFVSNLYWSDDMAQIDDRFYILVETILKSPFHEV